MADGESCSAERGEDLEIGDKAVLAGELRDEGAARAAEEAQARWSAPIFSLAKKASENLALSYGHALKSAALVGFVSKPVGNDSTAKTRTSLSGQIEERHTVKLVSATEETHLPVWKGGELPI